MYLWHSFLWNWAAMARTFSNVNPAASILCFSLTISPFFLRFPPRTNNHQYCISSELMKIYRDGSQDETRIVLYINSIQSSTTRSPPQATLPGVGGRGRSPLIRPGAPWPCPCRRRFSPLRRREGPRPLPPTSPPRQKLSRFTVFCALRIFSPFSELVAQDGSTWANIGVKKGEHSPKMGQHSPQEGPTLPQDGPT